MRGLSVSFFVLLCCVFQTSLVPSDWMEGRAAMWAGGLEWPMMSFACGRGGLKVSVGVVVASWEWGGGLKSWC